MKTKTNSHQIKRARTAVLRKRSVRRRPIHKRVLLHPFTAFLLLCTGVLTVGSTFHSQAVSYNVTAKVSAPALTDPAEIKQPIDQKHVSESLLSVQGDCPDDSYVSLYKDGVFGGSGICNNGGHFHIQTTLTAGANQLLVRVFNLTDDEGPASPPITVYYDVPVVVAPPIVPPGSSASAPITTLQVSNIEQGKYAKGVVEDATGHPTVSGYAPPFSDVTVTFYSEPSICRTKANSKGVWSCTLATALPPGLHHVVVEAVAPSGKKLTLPTFQIQVTQYTEPFVITSADHYRALRAGQAVEWKLALTGGTPPYKLQIDWGDGSDAQLVQQDRSEFIITHTYDSQVAPAQNYAVVIKATDDRGATTVLQLAALVNGGAALISTNGNIWGSMVSFVQRWLWVVWPAYIAVVLMAVSFWIGEREAYQRFVARRRIHKPHIKGGHR